MLIYLAKSRRSLLPFSAFQGAKGVPELCTTNRRSLLNCRRARFMYAELRDSQYGLGTITNSSALNTTHASLVGVRRLWSKAVAKTGFQRVSLDNFCFLEVAFYLLFFAFDFLLLRFMSRRKTPKCRKTLVLPTYTFVPVVRLICQSYSCIRSEPSDFT